MTFKENEAINLRVGEHGRGLRRKRKRGSDAILFQLESMFLKATGKNKLLCFGGGGKIAASATTVTKYCSRCFAVLSYKRLPEFGLERWLSN